MFSFEVPGGGSFHWGNLIASFWHGGLFGYGFRGEERGNLKTKKKTSIIVVSGRHRYFNTVASYILENLCNSKLHIINEFIPNQVIIQG